MRKLLIFIALTTLNTVLAQVVTNEYFITSSLRSEYYDSVGNKLPDEDPNTYEYTGHRHLFFNTKTGTGVMYCDGLNNTNYLNTGNSIELNLDPVFCKKLYHIIERATNASPVVIKIDTESKKIVTVEVKNL